MYGYDLSYSFNLAQNATVKGSAVKGGRIVGVGCAALKTARFHAKMCKVAYIFDLKLDRKIILKIEDTYLENTKA